MLFQKENSNISGHNEVRIYQNQGFPSPHLHHSAELIFVERGSIELHVNGTCVTVAGGRLALILPNQVHFFISGKDSKFWVQVFSTDCAPDFFGALGKRAAVSPVFDCSPEALAYYRSCCHDAAADGWIDYLTRLVVPQNMTPLRLRAALYAVLSEYLEGVELVERDGAGERLFGQVMSYISEHCTEELTLESVAADFGYEPHYFSRCLTQVSDTGFRRLINRCRVDRAMGLLEQDGGTITEVALSCGYSCMRTFNRVFMQLEGITPHEYRRRYRESNTGVTHE